MKVNYVKISNNIMKTLAKTKFSGHERQVLDVILLKTIGQNKHKNKISLSEFNKLTKINRNQICNILNRLISRNIIIKEKGEVNYYRFNKYSNRWLTRPTSKVLSTNNENMEVKQ